MQPLVSVNITAYNREAYIHEAITSVLQQDYTNLEIIIIDDGSTDRTVGIINAFRDPRISIYQNAVNKGIAFSRNLAASVSNGAYILILDSDDVAHETLISKKVAWLEAHKDHILVSSLMDYIDEDGQMISKKNGMIIPDKDIPFYLFFANCLVQSSMLIRAWVLKENEYRQDMRSEDYNLWMRISRLGKFHIMDVALINVRFHKTNVTYYDMHHPNKGGYDIAQLNMEALELLNSNEYLSLHVEFLNQTKTFSITKLIHLTSYLELVIKANSKLHLYNAMSFEEFILSKLAVRFNADMRVKNIPYFTTLVLKNKFIAPFKLALLKMLLHIPLNRIHSSVQKLHIA